MRLQAEAGSDVFLIPARAGMTIMDRTLTRCRSAWLGMVLAIS